MMRKHRIFRKALGIALSTALLLQAGGITASAWEETSEPAVTENAEETETEPEAGEMQTVRIENISSAVLYINRMDEDSFNAVYEIQGDALTGLGELLSGGISVEKTEDIPYPENVDNTALGCYDSDGFVVATFLSAEDSDKICISWEDGVGYVSDETKKEITKITDPFTNPGGITETAETEAEPETAQETDTETAWKTTRFTAKLIDDLYEHGEKNAVLSGPSVRFMLGTLYHGTGGTTKQAIEGLFGAGIDQFTSQEKSVLEDWGSMKDSGLSFTNIIIKNGDVKIKKDFSGAVKGLYGTRVLDAEEAVEETEDRKDGDKTETAIDGNILNALQSSDRHASFLDLAGVSEFTGRWMTPFNGALSEKTAFKDAGGKTYKTEMVKSTENVYLENTEASGFMKPYLNMAENGEPRLWFVGILPDRRSFSLDGLELEELMMSADDTQSVRVEMPVPNPESDLSVSKSISRNGLGALFLNEADLSGITDSVVRISDMFAKAKVTVDENRTEPAESEADETEAETIQADSEKQDETETESGEKTLLFSRPFAFGIYDSKTQEFLFLGRVDSVPES